MFGFVTQAAYPSFEVGSQRVFSGGPGFHCVIVIFGPASSVVALKAFPPSPIR